MKQPLADLLKKAAKTLPPQKPGKSSYRCFMPLLLEMQGAGHDPVSMTDFLVKEGEVTEAKRNSAYRSIRNLLIRNAPTPKSK